ncbi:MAG: hypothetical protein DMG03_22005 [Acidobacteria bacterium]|nr:MAG: hypothetical protein DMG03_22005 [Acidobacteriota bacterium]
MLADEPSNTWRSIASRATSGTSAGGAGIGSASSDCSIATPRIAGAASAVDAAHDQAVAPSTAVTIPRTVMRRPR